MPGPYLNAYAAEMGWREDKRRESNGELYLAQAKAALGHPIFRQWKGYWQGSAQPDSILGPASGDGVHGIFHAPSGGPLRLRGAPLSRFRELQVSP
jgi:hypothetical protein